MNQLVAQTAQEALIQVKATNELVDELMKSPHYAKLGRVGAFAVIEMAKSVGVDPMMAVNGGMYPVKGKVEMASITMNMLIRQAGHSVTKGRDSDDTICILHGKRADNGDTWVESFSIKDAQKAGLLNQGSWKMYTKDMLFARALSRLARQLFPDVIKGAYVQGEISLAPDLNSPPPQIEHQDEILELEGEGIEEDNYETLMSELESFPDYKEQVLNYWKRIGVASKDVTEEMADKIRDKLEKMKQE